MVRFVTQKDIAEYLGVSQSVVTHAFNRPHLIGDETRKKVLDAAKKLGYRENRLSRGIRQGKMRCFGLIFPDMSDSTSVRIFNSIVRCARKRGRQVLTCQPSTDSDSIQQQIQFLLAYRPEGLIAMPHHDGAGMDVYKQLIEDHIPLVTHSIKLEGMDVPYVGVNGKNLVDKVVKHLMQGGRRRLVCLHNDNSDLRRGGIVEHYTEVAKKNKLEVVLASAGDGLHDGYKTITKLLKHEKKFDAIFATNDRLALSAMNALKHVNLTIPNDVFLISVGNSDAVQLVDPAISSVDLAPEKIGKACVDLLMAQIEGPPVAKRDVLIPVSLHHRQSTSLKYSLPSWSAQKQT